MSYKLLVKDSRGQREILLIGTMTVGRDPRCDISDPDPLLSRRHAEFLVSASGVQVRDLNSRNGIVVNGKKLPHAELQPGDVVQVSQLAITLLSGAQARASAPAEPGEEKTMLVTAPAVAARVAAASQMATTASGGPPPPVDAGSRVHSSDAGTMRVARAAIVPEAPAAPPVTSSSATIHVPREQLEASAEPQASSSPAAPPTVEAPPPPAATPAPEPPAEAESDRTRFSPPPAFIREAVAASKAPSSATVATGPPVGAQVVPAPSPTPSPAAPAAQAPPAPSAKGPTIAAVAPRPAGPPPAAAPAWGTSAMVQVVAVSASSALASALGGWWFGGLALSLAAGLVVAVAGGLLVASAITRNVSNRLARFADHVDLAVVGKQSAVADTFGDRSGAELADALNELLARLRPDGR